MYWYDKDISANFIFYNGKIYSMDRSNRIYSAIAIKENKIIFLGNDNDVWRYYRRKFTRVIDLEGQMMLPSFTDAHLHPPGQYLCNYDLDLTPYASKKEYVEAVKEYIKNNADEEIVYGAGWSIQYFSGDDKKLGPSMEALNEIGSNKAIVLYSIDRHTAWLNQNAFDKFGITKETGKDVSIELANRIVKNDNGELRGIVVEDAMCYVPTKVYKDEEVLEAFINYQNDMHALGITNVIGIYVDYINGFFSPEEYMDFINKKVLKLRISYAGNITSKKVSNDKVLGVKEQVEQLIDLRKKFENKSDYFKVSAGKIFIDGVVEGLTAYLTSPYEYKAVGEYPKYGDFLWKNHEEDYREAVRLMNLNGFQVHNHSIGDGATKFVLDSFEILGKDLKKKCRNIITHLQLVRKRDIDRMSALKIIAVTQPFWHVKAPVYWEEVDYETLGERAEYEYPLQSLIGGGVLAVGSSDLPVTIPPNPILGIERGASRKMCGNGYLNTDFKFKKDDSTLLNRYERASVMDMIRMFTSNGAYATFRESEVGTLEVGKKADLIILSKNILKIPIETIHTAKVEMTMFDGEIVYTIQK